MTYQELISKIESEYKLQFLGFTDVYGQYDSHLWETPYGDSVSTDHFLWHFGDGDYLPSDFLNTLESVNTRKKSIELSKLLWRAEHHRSVIKFFDLYKKTGRLPNQ